MSARGGIMLLMSEIYSALGIFSADWYVVFCRSLLLQSPEKRRNAAHREAYFMHGVQNMLCFSTHSLHIFP